MVLSVADFWKYFGILTALLAAGLGAPIPEELPIITAGIMVGTADPDSTLQWWIMLPICIVGVVIGDGFLYGIGRFFGPWLLRHRWVQQKLLPEDRRKHIEERFHNNGIWVLLGARLLPTIRSPIFITAGMTRFPLTKFLIADGIYAIPGVTLLFTLAYWFGDRFKAVIDRVIAWRAQLIEDLIILAILAALIGAVVYVILRRPFATGDPPKMPHLPHLPHLPKLGDMLSKEGSHPPEPPSPEANNSAGPHNDNPQGVAADGQPRAELGPQGERE